MPQAPPTSQERLLPQNFPLQTPSPKFQLGDHVRFVPMPAEDYGTIVGIQFTLAEHLQDWVWRYVIWLDDQSPSRQWTRTDLAWEDDLQLLFPAPVDAVFREQPA